MGPQLLAEQAQGADPEDPDEYRALNIFWVPPAARWSHLKAHAKQPTIGQLVDDAMGGIERDNPSLKGVLPRDYARPALDKQRLGQLIDLVSNIKVGDAESRAKEVIGRVREYFLSQFASAEGKKKREFYAPRCVVKLLVEMLEPYQGRVYNPCCGSSGMFVQSVEFILANPPFNVSDWRGELLRDDQRWHYGVPPAWTRGAVVEREPLIPKHGGYRKLKSFQAAQLVYDVTVRFCDRYISRRSRTHDQMVQAARSGVQNITEGSQASGEALGLTDDEVAFYDALETNDSAVKILGDETLRTIARELVATVRANVSIDWTVRENVRAHLRVVVKRILRKHGYPPDKQAKATQTVLEQAEALSETWPAAA